MKSRCLRGSALPPPAALAWAGGSKPTAVQPPEKKIDPAEEPILKSADAFVQAFNKGDAKALAAAWTEKGTFTAADGKKLSGREAIEKAFTTLFAERKGLQLRIEVEDIRFVTPEVAEESGVSAILHADGSPPSRSRYVNIHVKKDGVWLLDSVKAAPFVPPSNFEHLQSLDSLVGSWVDDDPENGTTRIEFEWTENRNFLLAHFSTTLRGEITSGGTAWIGWDASAKTVRSWMFQNDGGFGHGTWKKDGGSWVSANEATLPDGKKATLTNVVTRVDANTLKWDVKDHKLDGQELPAGKAATMKRVLEK